MNIPRQSRQYVLELGVRLAEQQAEIERLRITAEQRGRLIEDMEAEIEKLVSDLAECRRLLRDAMQSKYMDSDGHVRWSMTAQWLLDAAKAAGGDDE